MLRLSHRRAGQADVVRTLARGGAVPHQLSRDYDAEREDAEHGVAEVGFDLDLIDRAGLAADRNAVPAVEQTPGVAVDRLPLGLGNRIRAGDAEILVVAAGGEEEEHSRGYPYGHRIPHPREDLLGWSGDPRARSLGRWRSLG